MSNEGIRKRTYANRTSYEVRWREAGKYRSRSFSSAADARRWRDEVRRRREIRGLNLVTGSEMTLSAFVVEWAKAKMPDLSPNTVRVYSYVLNRFILPDLGEVKLSELGPRMIEQWKQDHLAAGAGKRSIQQALGVLSNVCKSATAQELMVSNPCLVIDSPRMNRKSVVPLSPLEIEGLRQHMIEADHLEGAMLVSVLGYAGLRPSEAYALYWQDITDGAIRVVKKAVEGKILPYTKTQMPRSVLIRGPLAADIEQWREARAEPDPDELVFPRRDNRCMTRTDINNFRRRIFAPAREAINRTDVSPYTLRHSFASMLMAEGDLTPQDIAAECGHNVATLFRNYAHVIQGARTGKHQSFAEQIEEARYLIASNTQAVKWHA